MRRCDRGTMPAPGQFPALRQAPDRNRALRRHVAGVGTRAFHSVWLMHESRDPARQMGDRTRRLLAALARLRFSHTKNGEKNRISRSRKGLPRGPAARSRVSGELGPLYRGLPKVPSTGPPSNACHSTSLKNRFSDSRMETAANNYWNIGACPKNWPTPRAAIMTLAFYARRER